MESISIEKIPVHIHTFDSDQPTQLRLVNNEEIKSLEEQIKELKKKKAKLKAAKVEKLNEQEKKYLSRIQDLQVENMDKLSIESKLLGEVKLKQIDQEERQRKELLELDEFQQRELKMREERFDRTLKEEYSRYYKLREDFDETKMKFDNELTFIMAGHEAKMQHLSEFHSEKISQIQEAYNTLLAIMRKDSELYEGQLSRLEEEHEREVHQAHEKKQIELRKEKGKTDEYSRLIATQEESELKIREEQVIQTAELEKLKEIHDNLASEVESFRNKLSKTEEQIKERDDVINRKENTIKELKAFNIHLINFHFVLNQKIATLKEERDPLDRKIKEKEASIRDMYNELLEEFSKKNSLKEKSGKLREKNKAVEELNNALRNQIFQNKRKMTLFQSELAQMIKTSEKNKLVQALKELYDKQIKRASREEIDIESVNRNTDVRETLIEASFQKSQKEILKYHISVKERLNSIQKQNKQYNKEKTQAIFKKQHENAFLISTCNELRNEKQRLLKIISKLKDDVKDLNLMMPSSSNVGVMPNKMTFSASVPVFTELPASGSSQTFGLLEKKSSAGKLQSIVTQLDKNRDKLAQQTMEFKRLEQKMNDLLVGQKD